MDIEYANEILFPDRDKHGNPAFLNELTLRDPEKFKRKKPGDDLRRVLWILGWPDYEIDAYVQRAVKQQEELLREAGLSK